MHCFQIMKPTGSRSGMRIKKSDEENEEDAKTVYAGDDDDIEYSDLDEEGDSEEMEVKSEVED